MHPRGLYKQGLWPLQEQSHETLIYYFQLGSAERGPLTGSSLLGHIQERLAL
jgi:hypothetical protein